MRKEIRPAATVVILRDGNDGIEVFLLRRNPSIGDSHFGDALVFPGGVLDPEDEDPSWATVCKGAKDFGPVADTVHSPLSFWIAAIRECYEEAGIFFGHYRDGEGVAEDKLGDWRKQLDSVPLFDLVQRESLSLSPTDLVYYSHWITPGGRPQRFDTRFFLARCPAGQQGYHDGFEAIDSHWMTAAQVLSKFRDGSVTLWPPTQFTLLAISEFQRVNDMMQFVSDKPKAGVPAILPKLVPHENKARPIFPWDDDWLSQK